RNQTCRFHAPHTPLSLRVSQLPSNSGGDCEATVWLCIRRLHTFPPSVHQPRARPGRSHRNPVPAGPRHFRIEDPYQHPPAQCQTTLELPIDDCRLTIAGGWGLELAIGDWRLAIAGGQGLELPIAD